MVVVEPVIVELLTSPGAAALRLTEI